MKQTFYPDKTIYKGFVIRNKTVYSEVFSLHEHFVYYIDRQTLSIKIHRESTLKGAKKFVKNLIKGKEE